MVEYGDEEEYELGLKAQTGKSFAMYQLTGPLKNVTIMALSSLAVAGFLSTIYAIA